MAPRQIVNIKIDGNTYDWPAFDTLTLDEADQIYHYSKLTLDQISELEGFHAGVIMGLAHVAIARTRTDLKAREIEEVVRAIKVTAIPDMVEREPEPEAGDDADPPAETPGKTSDAGELSGRTSEPTGDTSQASDPPAHSGSRPSDTGAGSRPMISAQ